MIWPIEKNSGHRQDNQRSRARQPPLPLPNSEQEIPTATTLPAKENMGK
jgi:hypothetical protein